MKTLIAFLIAAILILATATAAWATWYPGIVHAHSTFSDGDRTPGMLKNAAAIWPYQFLIVTDHYEQINLERKWTGLMTDDFGFDKYLTDFSDGPNNRYNNKPLVVIPGAELMYNNNQSHLLAIGDLTEAFKQPKPASQDEAIKQFDGQNILTVAAHPNSSKYPFDKTQAEGINGIEFFNENNEQYKQTRDWYLSLIQRGKDIFVTAGCDTHTSVDPTKFDLIRWTRMTCVWVNGSLTRENLLEGLRQGKTYASQYGAYIKGINYLPGFDANQVDEDRTTKLKVTLAFPRPISEAKKVRLYLDGQAFGRVLEWDLKVGQKELTLETAGVISDGDFNYIVEIENCLVTSPIRFHALKAANPETAQTPRPVELQADTITKFTGGVPILLGKTFEEVEQTMSSSGWKEQHKFDWLEKQYKNPQWPLYPPREYVRYYYPEEYKCRYVLHASFHRYPEVVGPADSQIHSVGIKNQWGKEYLSAKEIIPAEILNHKPSGIYRSPAYNNAITIVWYIDGKFFIAELSDSDIRPLYTTVKTYRQRNRYYVNKNTFNFQNCQRVIAFMYTDKIIDKITTVECSETVEDYIYITGFAYHFNLMLFDK